MRYEVTIAWLLSLILFFFFLFYLRTLHLDPIIQTGIVAYLTLRECRNCTVNLRVFASTLKPHTHLDGKRWPVQPIFGVRIPKDNGHNSLKCEPAIDSQVEELTYLAPVYLSQRNRLWAITDSVSWKGMFSHLLYYQSEQQIF